MNTAEYAVVGDAGYHHVECARKAYGAIKVNSLIAGKWHGKRIDAFNGIGPKDREGNVLGLYSVDSLPTDASCDDCLTLVNPYVTVCDTADSWPDYEGIDECPGCDADISNLDDMTACPNCGYELWVLGYPTCDNCQEHIVGRYYVADSGTYCTECASK